jgi:acyl-CoA reductase-like NAD-dependent aldehyde dehydrogenase
MAAATHRLFIGGSWRDGKTTTEIRSPWDSRPVATVHLADASDLEDAIAAADTAFSDFRRTSRHQY